MKINEVMTSGSLQCCNTETTLADAAKMMKTGNCGALPVIDKDQKVVGIITDRDICLSLAKKNSQSPEKVAVGKIMPTEIYTVKETDDVTTAYQQMRTNKIGRLPVIDEQGKLKGIVSLHNLINKAITKGKEDLGNLSSSEENLLRTIHAIANRYNGEPEKSQKTDTAKKVSPEMEYEESN